MGGKQSTAVASTSKTLVATLWKYDPSPPCRAVMMMCDLLKLNINRIDVDIGACENASSEFRLRNPLQTVPLLQDGETIVWDSHIINIYLATKYGGSQAKTLYPSELKEKTLVDIRLYFDTSFLYPRFRGCIDPILFNNEKCITKASVRSICEAYCILEVFLCGRTFLAGNQLTLADVNCIATVSTLAVLVPISPEAYPKLYKWYCMMCQECFFTTGNLPGLCCFEDRLRKIIFGKT